LLLITNLLFVINVTYSQSDIDSNHAKSLTLISPSDDNFQFINENNSNSYNDKQSVSLSVIKDYSVLAEKFRNSESNEVKFYLSEKSAFAGSNNVIVNISLKQPASDDYRVALDYSGGSAVNGVDIEKLPNYIKFRKGEQNQCLIIKHFKSNKKISGKYLKIRARTSEKTYSDLTVDINYDADLRANICNDITIKKGEEATLSASPSGGIEPYLYQWSEDSENSTTIKVSPRETKSYTLIIMDSFGKVIKATVKVIVKQ
jgi:hypothetical protein